MAANNFPQKAENICRNDKYLAYEAQTQRGEEMALGDSHACPCSMARFCRALLSLLFWLFYAGCTLARKKSSS